MTNILKFYRCGICECFHPLEWNGDCRENANRFAMDELDSAHGANGWEEVPMPGTKEQPLTFFWHRRADRHGVRWELWSRYSARHLGSCFYLSGSKRYVCSASAPVKGGVVLCGYFAGTAAAARRALERDWDKRSIGLFGMDDIAFEVVT